MLLTRRLNLRDGERVAAIVRRSLLAYAGAMVLAIASVVLAFFLLTPLVARGRLGVVVFAFLLAFGVGAAARIVWLWYWNTFVITDARVIDVDQRGFFRRSITEARYEKIDDVTIDIHGVLATLFHLGTVRLQTAMGLVRIELRLVPRPEVVQEIIGRLQAAVRPSLATHTDDMDLVRLTDVELLKLRERLEVEEHRRRTAHPTEDV